MKILYLAFQIAARRQDQRRHGLAHLAQALEQSSSRAIGQLNIDYDKVVMIRLREFQPVGRRKHSVNGVTFRLQAPLKDIVQFLLVFDNQDAHSRHPLMNRWESHPFGPPQLSAAPTTSLCFILAPWRKRSPSAAYARRRR